MNNIAVYLWGGKRKNKQKKMMMKKQHTHTNFIHSKCYIAFHLCDYTFVLDNIRFLKIEQKIYKNKERKSYSFYVDGWGEAHILGRLIRVYLFCMFSGCVFSSHSYQMVHVLYVYTHHADLQAKKYFCIVLPNRLSSKKIGSYFELNIIAENNSR